jgi:hypothetical protein
MSKRRARRSPAPDGPGDHDHEPAIFRERQPPRPGYFDRGLGRAGWSPDERCAVDELCALRGGHGGGCDPRPEPERVRAVHELLYFVDDRGLEAAVEASAADALRRARS